MQCWLVEHKFPVWTLNLRGDPAPPLGRVWWHRFCRRSGWWTVDVRWRYTFSLPVPCPELPVQSKILQKNLRYVNIYIPRKVCLQAFYFTYCIKGNICSCFIFAPFSPQCQQTILRLGKFKTVFKFQCSLERVSIIYVIICTNSRWGETICKCWRTNEKWGKITLLYNYQKRLKQVCVKSAQNQWRESMEMMVDIETECYFQLTT